MYSNSPGNDLYYIGDSFDNLDYVDITKIKSNKLSYIKDGSAKLNSRTSIQWITNSISVDEEFSNGFIGNNHAVYRTDNVDSNTKYYFEDNLKVGYILNVTDNSPLTYFEYEALNIPSSLRRARGAVDYEFLYSSVKKENDRDVIKYSSWADHNPLEPLRLGLSIMSTKPQKTNSLTIIPHLGNQTYTYPEVKIVRISAVSADTNNEIDLITDPIYIGSTVVPQSIESMKNYFYEKATIDFPEINTAKINVYFEQQNKQEVEIKHLYWKQINQRADSLFSGQLRFNPEILQSTGYEAINYNINSVIPTVQEPVKFKVNTNAISKTIAVSARRTRVPQNIHVVKFQRLVNSTLTNHYLVSQFPASSTAPLVEQQNRAATTNRDQAISFSSIEEANTVKTFLQRQLSNSGATTGRVYSWDPLMFQNISIETFTEFTDKEYRETATLQPQYESYQASKWSIGIKSIEAHYNIYDNSAQIVSKPYEFPYEVKTLMISSEVDPQSINSGNVKYYVSVDDGNKWIAISPIENPFTGTPEVLSFNESLFGATQIPGVSYLNYPQVPKEVRKVRVKIDINKPANSNISPVIYSYKLSTKVEQI